jgi:hypothetical protein
MNATERDLIMQRWNVIQHELLPELCHDVGTLTPKLERVIHTLEWIRIEEFVTSTWCGIGRPPSERAWLANAFVAKAVLGLATTAGLIERLAIDRALRRICGFPLCKKVPSESTFSRAFSEFAECRLPERVHEALIKTHLGGELIGHLSRDGTAIHARERPARSKDPEPAGETTAPAARPRKKRGRPARGEARPAARLAPLERQRQQTLAQMLADMPTRCDRGAKCNAQGYKMSWNGYKLHIEGVAFTKSQLLAKARIATKASAAETEGCVLWLTAGPSKKFGRLLQEAHHKKRLQRGQACRLNTCRLGVLQEAQSWAFLHYLAETEGFEPSIQVYARMLP